MDHVHITTRTRAAKADTLGRCLLLGVLLVVQPGCFTVARQNSAFPATWQEIADDHTRMRTEAVGLTRPVLVLSGYRSPSLVARKLAYEIRRLTGAEPEQIAWLSYIDAGTIEGPARRAVALVEKRFPSDDPEWTTEVDVVAVSMGGLVARLASADPELRDEPGGKRLRIRTLYTLGSPHRGAVLAERIRLDDASRDMKPGSSFLERLDGAFEERGYEVVPYAVLRDGWVGATRSAPVGQDPIWVPGRWVLSHHMISLNRRIQADLARRLRGEEPLGSPSMPPRD